MFDSNQTATNEDFHACKQTIDRMMAQMRLTMSEVMSMLVLVHRQRAGEGTAVPASMAPKVEKYDDDCDLALAAGTMSV